MFDARSGDDPRDAEPREADQSRGRDHDDTRSLGRGGGGSDRQTSDEQSRDARDDARWANRDREAPERPRDPHVFARHVDLPRGPERERVRDRDRTYTLRGSESRTLGTVGAFRVVSSSDLRDHDGSRSNLRSGDLRHLREQGLIETARVPGYRDHAVALTKAGHSLLERHRDSRPERHQTFHAGLVRSREREHDLQVYRAYEKAEERLRERGAQVERVVLDHELKSDYQRWLHEHDNDHDDYDGHPSNAPARNDLRVADDASEGAAFYAAPVGDKASTGTEPRRERPRCRYPWPDQAAAPGSFTSRLSMSVVALLQRADLTREHAQIVPQNRGHLCREADTPIWDCSGAKARVKATLRSVGTARP